MTPATGSEEMALVAVRSPVGLVAAAHCEVEAAIVERDVALRFQGSAQVAPLERRAAATACVVLDSAIDYLDGEVQLLQEQLDRTDAAGAPGEGLQRAHAAAQQAADEGMILLPTSAAPVPFSGVESKLLALAGLAEVLAERHVRGAVEAFRRQGWSYDLSTHTYHQAVMTRLERGRDAVRTYAETLEIEQLVARLAPSLLAISGCAALTAAKIVGETAGIDRFRSRDAYASHNGTAPLPVWSSNRARHRLSRTGNRQLNAALHRIALTQAHWHPDARALIARRKANGDGGLEALRILKRRLSDVVYRALTEDFNTNPSPTP